MYTYWCWAVVGLVGMHSDCVRAAAVVHVRVVSAPSAWCQRLVVSVCARLVPRRACARFGKDSCCLVARDR